MTGAHSILPPSSSARRKQCPASTLRESLYPETEESPEAAEGTAAHWALAEMLEGRTIAVGLIAPNGLYLTDEMVEGAEIAHEAIAAVVGPWGLKPSDGLVEKPVRIPRVHPESWGTPDYRCWHPALPLLFVADFKFGFGIVDEFENDQIIEYTSGSVSTDRPDLHDLQVEVHSMILQPRANHPRGPVRRWDFNLSSVRAHLNVSASSATEALGPNPRERVGPECKHCRGRHTCQSLQRAAADACAEAQARAPFDMDPHALAAEFRRLKWAEKLLAARLTGLEAEATSRIRSGARVPGLKLENGAGRTVWTVDPLSVVTIGRVFSLDLAKPLEAVTPKQAVAKGLDSKLLEGITNTPRGEAKLVLDDNSLARRVFGGRS